MCHVLIIEDEPLIAMDLEALLQREGATSFSFADSEQDAVASAIAHTPAIITSDVVLQEGTGPSAVASILARLGPTPVLFITATPEACRPCAPSGRILSKPMDRSAIRQAFRDMTAGT